MMESKSKIFPGLTLKCCYDNEKSCVCGDEESVLRNCYNGTIEVVMTPEQREWCISQADWAAEGHYTREELSAMNDKDLQCAVLTAWTMYAESHS